MNYDIINKKMISYLMEWLWHHRYDMDSDINYDIYYDIIVHVRDILVHHIPMMSYMI